METIWTIIEEAGGLDAAANVRIENPPYQRLVIEMLPEGGPEGHRAVSIAHYGELNGDLIRDPEVCAEIVVEEGTPVLWPYSFRNDVIGFGQVSRWRDREGNVNCLPGETQEIEEFLAMWDRNLREQGYLEAFRRTRAPAGGGQ